MPAEKEYDVFLFRASQDKDVDAIMHPLSEAFKQAGISFLPDEVEIKSGEKIAQKINQGMSTSRDLMIVLSPAFLWSPEVEEYARRGLRSAIDEQLTKGGVKVLPLLVGSEEQMERFFSAFRLIRGLRYVVWDNNPKQVADRLLRLRDECPDSKTVARICLISSEYPPHVLGGLGVHVEQLTTALGAHPNVNVDVVLPTPQRYEYLSSNPQVHLYPLANAKAGFGIGSRALYENYPTPWLHFADVATQKVILLSSNTRPDVIHCHDWVTVLAGIKCRWALEIPLVFHLHLPNRSRLCASVENLGLVCADLITVNSQAMYKELVERRFAQGRPGDQRLRLLREAFRCNPEVVKNGVDLNVFCPCKDWPADDGYILFVGRLVQQKGVEYLLRAFSYVRKKFSDVCLKIVGEGPLECGLKALCENLMLSGQVEFLGWKTGPELVELYQKARVVAIPSIYEPFGMTALESLACQRPVVASNIGGLPEIIKDSGAGYLAQPNDELDLAQGLMSLLHDSKRRNEMGEAGRKHVSNNGYTWPQIAQRCVELYKDLLGKPLDMKIPEGAEEFIAQIKRVAVQMSPVPDITTGEMNDLFKIFTVV